MGESFSPSKYYQCESLNTGMQQQPPLAHEATEEIFKQRILNSSL